MLSYKVIKEQEKKERTNTDFSVKQLTKLL